MSWDQGAGMFQYFRLFLFSPELVNLFLWLVCLMRSSPAITIAIVRTTTNGYNQMPGVKAAIAGVLAMKIKTGVLAMLVAITGILAMLEVTTGTKVVVVLVATTGTKVVVAVATTGTKEAAATLVDSTMPKVVVAVVIAPAASMFSLPIQVFFFFFTIEDNGNSSR